MPRAAKSWAQAIRPLSYSYLFLSLSLGHAIFFKEVGQIDLALFCSVSLLGLLIQAYIVFANDYADYATDCLNSNPTTFSGGSRVLVSGKIARSTLGFAAIIMGASVCLGGLLLSWKTARIAPLLLSCAAIVLLYCYSYRPLRLSYRGGGELLQVLGLGLVLPTLAFSSQGGQHFAWEPCLALLPSHLACAMATALGDEPSDRKSGKRTMVVFLGQIPSSVMIFTLHMASIAALFFIKLWSLNLLSYILGCLTGLLLIGFLKKWATKPGQNGMGMKIFYGASPCQFLTLFAIVDLISKH